MVEPFSERGGTTRRYCEVVDNELGFDVSS